VRELARGWAKAMGRAWAPVREMAKVTGRRKEMATAMATAVATEIERATEMERATAKAKVMQMVTGIWTARETEMAKETGTAKSLRHSTYSHQRATDNPCHNNRCCSHTIQVSSHL
jgi:hypothetical protein